jgi:AraC-like DNA-binding protein
VLRPATDIADFLSRPYGRYVVEATWIGFCSCEAKETLSGFVVWGMPKADDVRDLTRIITVRDSPLISPMARWMDLRRIEATDPSAFSVFSDHIVAQGSLLRRTLTRVAVLHSGGIMEALVAGFNSVIPVPYPMRSFTRPEPALAWLGFPTDLPFVGELDAIHASALGTTPLLRDLSEWLEQRLRDASLSKAAAGLGMSSRTLQRRLREHGTSFHERLTATRLEVAKRLLSETPAQVTAIAYEVGCGSVHHLDVLFRKDTGSTPSRWRAAHQASSSVRQPLSPGEPADPFPIASADLY